MYIPTDFKTENNKHNQAIAALRAYYNGKKKIVELPGKNNVGYDLLIDDLHVEIKTNTGAGKSGPYKTFLIETYADHDQVKQPEWRYADVDYLIVFNRFARKAYIYSIPELRDYVTKNESSQVPSGVSVGMYNTANKKCSWGVKINWNCKEAGCVKELDLQEFWYD